MSFIQLLGTDVPDSRGGCCYGGALFTHLSQPTTPAPATTSTSTSCRPLTSLPTDGGPVRNETVTVIQPPSPPQQPSPASFASAANTPGPPQAPSSPQGQPQEEGLIFFNCPEGSQRFSSEGSIRLVRVRCFCFTRYGRNGVPHPHPRTPFMAPDPCPTQQGARTPAIQNHKGACTAWMGLPGLLFTANDAGVSQASFLGPTHAPKWRQGEEAEGFTTEEQQRGVRVRELFTTTTTTARAPSSPPSPLGDEAGVEKFLTALYRHYFRHRKMRFLLLEPLAQRPSQRMHPYSQRAAHSDDGGEEDHTDNHHHHHHDTDDDDDDEGEEEDIVRVIPLSRHSLMLQLRVSAPSRHRQGRPEKPPSDDDDDDDDEFVREEDEKVNISNRNAAGDGTPAEEVYSYVILEAPPATFDARLARQLGVRPGPKYGLLKNGIPVEADEAMEKERRSETNQKNQDNTGPTPTGPRASTSSALPLTDYTTGRKRERGRGGSDVNPGGHHHPQTPRTEAASATSAASTTLLPSCTRRMVYPSEVLKEGSTNSASLFVSLILDSDTPQDLRYTLDRLFLPPRPRNDHPNKNKNNSKNSMNNNILDNSDNGEDTHTHRTTRRGMVETDEEKESLLIRLLRRHAPDTFLYTEGATEDPQRPEEGNPLPNPRRSSTSSDETLARNAKEIERHLHRTEQKEEAQAAEKKCGKDESCTDTDTRRDEYPTPPQQQQQQRRRRRRKLVLQQVVHLQPFSYFMMHSSCYQQIRHEVEGVSEYDASVTTQKMTNEEEETENARRAESARKAKTVWKDQRDMFHSYLSFLLHPLVSRDGPFTCQQQELVWNFDDTSRVTSSSSSSSVSKVDDKKARIPGDGARVRHIFTARVYSRYTAFPTALVHRHHLHLLAPALFPDTPARASSPGTEERAGGFFLKTRAEEDDEDANATTRASSLISPVQYWPYAFRWRCIPEENRSSPAAVVRGGTMGGAVNLLVDDRKRLIRYPSRRSAEAMLSEDLKEQIRRAYPTTTTTTTTTREKEMRHYASSPPPPGGALVFLGTGSAVPSKYRNVSGAYVQLTLPAACFHPEEPQDPAVDEHSRRTKRIEKKKEAKGEEDKEDIVGRAVVVLDWGEGSCGQLQHILASETDSTTISSRSSAAAWRSVFGATCCRAEALTAFLRDLKIIFLSHAHADHHLGVVSLLELRHAYLVAQEHQHIDEESPSSHLRPLVVVCPQEVYDWLCDTWFSTEPYASYIWSECVFDVMETDGNFFPVRDPFDWPDEKAENERGRNKHQIPLQGVSMHSKGRVQEETDQQAQEEEEGRPPSPLHSSPRHDARQDPLDPPPLFREEEAFRRRKFVSQLKPLPHLMRLFEVWNQYIADYTASAAPTAATGSPPSSHLHLDGSGATPYRSGTPLEPSSISLREPPVPFWDAQGFTVMHPANAHALLLRFPLLLPLPPEETCEERRQEKVQNKGKDAAPESERLHAEDRDAVGPGLERTDPQAARRVRWTSKVLLFSGDTRPSRALIARTHAFLHHHSVKEDRILSKKKIEKEQEKLFICLHEATFGPGYEAEAQRKCHSTLHEALQVGVKALDADHVVLNHFSQRYPKIPDIHAASRSLWGGGGGEEGHTRDGEEQVDNSRTVVATDGAGRDVLKNNGASVEERGAEMIDEGRQVAKEEAPEQRDRPLADRLSFAFDCMRLSFDVLMNNSTGGVIQRFLPLSMRLLDEYSSWEHGTTARMRGAGTE